MTSPTTDADSRSRVPSGTGHPLRVLAVAVATFVLLVVAGIALRPGQDLWLAQALNGLHTGTLGALASTVYRIFEPVPSVVLTVVGAVILWVARGLRSGAAFAGVVALTWIPTEVVKIVVHRGRPDVHAILHPYLPVQVDPSYPSGHTAFVVALVIALAYVLRGTRLHAWVVGLGTLLTVLVALALAVDAVHYPSDILASVVWSLAVAPAARLVWVDGVLARLPWLPPDKAVPGPPAPVAAGLEGPRETV